MKKSKKVLLISGSSSGLGKDLAKYYIKKNYFVVGCGRKPSGIFSKSYSHTILDINDEFKARKWINEIFLKHKKIDYFINSAAFIPVSYPSLLNDIKLVERVFKTNVIAQINLINEVGKKMIKKNFGRIINFSSMSVGLLEKGTALYSSSKKSVETYSKIFSKEVIKSNVTCNTIAISMYYSKAFKHINSKIIENSKNQLLIKRTLKLQEISNVIDFFFNKESNVITGQTIYIGLVN